MRFLDIFNEIQKGNYALTDEAIYSSIKNGDQLIPIYGGSKEHNTTERRVSISAKTKKGTPITVFSGEGIIISLDGSAGSMTYKNGEVFALNHHAGFITVRDTAKEKVCLEYFAMFFQNFYRSLSVSEGSKTLSLEQIYSENIDLPSYDLQIKIINKINIVHSKLVNLSLLKQKYVNMLNKEVVFPYQQYQDKNVSINRCLDYLSGTSGVTEEKNYLRLRSNGKIYDLLTGATTKPPQKIVISDEDSIKRFVNKEGLLVTRKGKAGITRYLPAGKYVLNDDAYILFQKEGNNYEINLKWLAIQYRESFLKFSSSADNGTWNMTGFFKHTKIDIPSIEEQLYLVKIYEKLEQRISAIQRIESHFNDIVSKEISIA